eukprot:TRINITY_DN16232_c0_g4_i1.p1 TRINITY_DN16232_c0_g4~~TRINITY_DN16232_c0_g4_i1.p1  ORF type:complete len:500 (-),score=41.48 TRINITY_DN16232_c0_g4_i1:29-1528(-)
MGTSSHDFYALLQISERASPSEIRAAYRRAALICHPDKGGTSQSFQLLVRAFDTLSDNHRRHLYDVRRGRRKRRATHAADPVRGGDAQASYDEETSSKGGSCSRQETMGAGGSSCSGQPKTASCQEERNLCRRLQVSLERLRRAVESVPAGRRRDLIKALDGRVKVQLAKWMEVKRCKQERNIQMLLADSDSESEADSASEYSEISREGIRGNFAICDVDVEHRMEMPDLRENADSVSDSARCSGRYQKTRVSHGLERFTGQSGNVQYRASSSISRLTFFTQRHSKLEVAVDHHIVLMQIRQTICHLVDEGADTIENIQASVDEVIRSSRPSTDDMGLRAYAYIYVRGSYLASPVLPLKEVLQWRCRMMRCKFGTIKDFRDMCLELIQHPARRRHCTKDRAEAITQALIAKVQPHWGKFRSFKGFIEGSRTREKRVESAARVVARDIKSLFEKRRRGAHQEAKKQRKLEIERHKWLHRKPGKDMTMDDLQQRLPQHLRQ